MTHTQDLIDRLSAWRPSYLREYPNMVLEDAARVVAALEAQAAELARLREALRPFASSWKIAQASGLSDMANLGAIARNETAAICFMRAFSALSSTGEKG